MPSKHEVTFKDITTLLYLGPAIIHADTFYRKELHDGKIYEADYQVYAILYATSLVDKEGKLTQTGNEAFACVDLIRYYLITGSNMAINKKPAKLVWEYDLLRKGLGQQVYIHSVEYLDFIHSYIKEPIHTLIDIGGGDGSYLELLGERYDIPMCILLDKDIEVVANRINATHDHRDRYRFIQTDIGKSFQEKIKPYKADLMLLNEVLHLNDDLWWDHLITEALLNLKPGGQVCIGEVTPEPAFDWRMHSYTESGNSISLDHFMSWINMLYKNNFEDEIGVFETSTHWFVILTKKGELDA